MKKLALALVLAANTAVSAQPLDIVVDIVPSLAFRWFLDYTDEDKLENTPPVTITASGTGETCDAALINAKRTALDKVNGTWVHSKQRSKNGSYDEEIVQHSGGVIKSYKYLRNDCTFVIIEAQVMKRSNRVQLEAANIDRPTIIHLEGIKSERDSRTRAIQKLNNRREAVFFSPKRTSIELLHREDVAVKIRGDLAYTDKWKADYLELRQMVGYFNLDNWDAQPKVLITGYDSIGDKVYQTHFVYEGGFRLWSRKSYGANYTWEIHPNQKEEITVKFKIPYDKLRRVSKFVIEVI